MISVVVFITTKFRIGKTKRVGNQAAGTRVTAQADRFYKRTNSAKRHGDYYIKEARYNTSQCQRKVPPISRTPERTLCLCCIRGPDDISCPSNFDAKCTSVLQMVKSIK